MLLSKPSLSRQLCSQVLVLLPVVAGLAIMLGSTNASAADRLSRLHGSAHSAGSAASLHTSEPRRGSSRHRSEESYARPSSKTSRSSAKASKAIPANGKAHANDARHKRREPEIVDDPITVRRADSRSGRRGTKNHEVLEARNVRGKHDTQKHSKSRTDETYYAPLSTYAASHTRAERTHPITLARAAEPAHDVIAPRTAPAAPRTYFASGEAHPMDDGTVAELDDPAVPDPASVRPRPSSVVIRPQPEAVISANDAPTLPARSMQPKVVTGFGAEVAPAPAAARSNVTAGQAQFGTPESADNFSVSNSPRSLAATAEQPMVLPEFTRGGRLIMPAPLKGSHEILVHQNIMADRDGLERIRSDRELDHLLDTHMLVGFPEMSGLRVNSTLPMNRRAARPWTVKFAADAARAFYAQFGEPLFVTSAVRTVAYQLRLQRVNGNAAAIDGDGASPHLTGQAIDLAKHSMNADEIAWMRTYLAQFIEAGTIDVEEEFRQACFHISVYRAYMPAPSYHRKNESRFQVAQLHPEAKVAAPAAADAEDFNEK